MRVLVNAVPARVPSAALAHLPAIPLHSCSPFARAVPCTLAPSRLPPAAVPKKGAEPEPDWMHRPGFGTVPAYLGEVKMLREAEHDYIQSLLDQKQVRPPNHKRTPTLSGYILTVGGPLPGSVYSCASCAHVYIHVFLRRPYHTLLISACPPMPLCAFAPCCSDGGGGGLGRAHARADGRRA